LGVLDLNLDPEVKMFAPIEQGAAVAERAAKERGAQELVRQMVLELGSTSDFAADSDSASGGLTAFLGPALAGVAEQRATALRLAEVEKKLQEAEAAAKLQTPRQRLHWQQRKWQRQRPRKQ
jgi:hypothetical protein